MIKTIMVLQDGTAISSGIGTSSAIKNCEVIQSVNDGNEYTPGSCCAACAKITVYAPRGELSISAGTSFTLYRDVDGQRRKVGVFIAEKPTRASSNVYKVTAYDRITLLDKDLSSWLDELEWDPDISVPLCTLAEFAERVCIRCGVTLDNAGSIPNADLKVMRFHRARVTGRQLIRWIGECSGRFCRATAEGHLEFAKYEDRTGSVVLSPSGSSYYFAGTLSHEDYDVAAIDGLHYVGLAGYMIRWSQDAGYPDTNPYVIDDDPIWSVRPRAPQAIQDTAQQARDLVTQLASLGAYRPGKVAVPAALDIAAGDIVTVVSAAGERLRMVVMTKAVTGHRAVLTCVGSSSRTSTSAVNRSVGRRNSSDMSESEILERLGAVWQDIDGVKVLVKKENST